MVREFVTYNSTPLDSLPPENIESEEAILGGILLDTEAIFRVWDKLQPEHFYIDSHRDIYKACIKLARNNKPTDLLTVTNYLNDHGKLDRIGGRNKLASLLDRIVTTVNIDRLADLVIEKFVRRQLISLDNELMHLGYQTHSELAEILQTIKQKTEWFTNCPWGQTEKEFDRWHYDQLLNKLQSIHRNIADPGFKIWKLQQLAKQNGKTLRDLENIYQKSLCAVVEPRQTLDQIEASVGGSAREFLLNGLAPKGTSILLYADGGVGKTKFLYDICHSLSTGQNWNGFPVTAPSRKILLYQGDESKRDMLQALNKRGFKPGTDARENLQVRFGWNFDAIPLLVQDIQEFQPDIVFIDSMTYANRFSIYDENRTEYARPVLELTAIAQEYGVTIVIVHHSSRGSGKPRGTTAIFNAVSEVLKLERDTSIKANGQEKILTIEKSRSRRFPCQYRLFFNEEDFSFSLLEEIGQEMGSPDLPLKDRIVEFLLEHRNTKYTSEEMTYYIAGSDNRT
ncbi:hypothetical protein BLD44_017255 [Mastigocladus laminosus UU774]|nr:hypothetical protein BLD44_017255 [Mastigocladus laminosus UU774]